MISGIIHTSSKYTQEEADEVIRRTLDPCVLATGFTSGQTYTYPPNPEPAAIADTNHKIPIPAAVLRVNCFAVVDFGGGDTAIQYQGDKAGWYRLHISTSATTSANQIITTFGLLVNSFVPAGCFETDFSSTGSEVSSHSPGGQVYLNPLDRIDFFVHFDKASYITFESFSFALEESN